jgi:hypothetical protein
MGAIVPRLAAVLGQGAVAWLKSCGASLKSAVITAVVAAEFGAGAGNTGAERKRRKKYAKAAK